MDGQEDRGHEAQEDDVHDVEPQQCVLADLETAQQDR